MNAPHNSAQARAWRKRTAAVFAAVGALIFSSGIVMLTAPAANAADKVWVCHQTSADSNAWVAIHVSSNSARLQAHLAHGDATATTQDGLPEVCRGVTSTQPEDVVTANTESEVTCADGTRTRSVTVTKEYVWSDDTNSWALEDQADWDVVPGDWSGWVPLTSAEKAANNCPVPEKPAVQTRSVARSSESCERGGVVSWSDVYTTDYSWDAERWDWVAGPETGPVATGESFVQYTLEQRAAKCDDNAGNPGGGDNGNPGGGNQGGGNQGGGGNETPPTIPNPELIPVTPAYASATDATCSRRGALIVPSQPAGVLATRSGSVPGTVTFTYAPAAGYAFPAGTVTKQQVKVDKKLSGDECVLGDEEVKPTHTSKPTHQAKPKPRDRGPVVLGTQAAVPTAVDAGLASLPTSVVSSTGSPRLAQALVAGGLLMLVAGGSMGLGRRTRGAHES